jgi:ketosteroid isomerase-like protein
MTNDIDQIRKTVEAYFAGVSTQSYDKFLESWHPEARMVFVKDGEPGSVGRDFWENWCKQPMEPETTVKAWIESIDITGVVAAVRSKMIRDNPKITYNFTDFLTLLKNGDGTWTIINKAYNSVVTEK